jgi:hypothetical protein
MKRGILQHPTKAYPEPYEVEKVLDDHPGIRESVLATSYAKQVCPHALCGFFHYIFNQIDPDMCKHFFDGLASGANLPDGSPVLALRNQLMNLRNRENVKTREERIAIFVKAWNHLRAGKSVKQIKWIPDGAKPELFPAISGFLV